MRMKILEIENFGVHSGQRFEFSSSGLQLVYGANEAGKTTLLQLVRSLLFGFPHVSEYATMVDGRQVAASCLLNLRDGQEVRMRRRKGRKDTVSGEFCRSGKLIDEEQWKQILEGASAELFQNVFAFSLAELTAGQESLSHANLSEALFGGGVGGLGRFQSLRQAVAAEADELYNPRGRNPLINQLLRRLGDQVRETRELVFRPSQFDQLRSDLDDVETERDRYRVQVADLRKKQERLRRLRQSQTACRELAEARHQWEELGEVAVVPNGAQEKLERLTAQLESLVADLVEGQRKFEMFGDAAVGDSSGESEETSQTLQRWLTVSATLHQQVDQIQGYRRDIPARRTEAKTLLRDVRVQLQQWLPNADLEMLDTLPLRRPDADRCHQWAEELEQGRLKMDALQERCDELDSDLAMSQASLAASNGESVDLRPVFFAGSEYLRESNTLDELDEENQRLEDRLDHWRRALGSVLSGSADEDAWAGTVPPTIAEAQAFVVRAARAAEDVATNSGHQRHWKCEIERLDREIDAFVQREALPDPEVLEKLRQNRDGELAALAQTIESGAMDRAELANRIQALRSGVKEADQLIDQLLRQANDVAHFQRQRQERHRAIEQLTRSETELVEAEQRSAEVLDQWRQQCEQSKLGSIAPAAFVDWRRQWDLAQDTWLRWRAVQRKREQTEETCQRHLTIWNEYESGESPTASSVRDIGARIEAIQRIEVERAEGRKRVKEFKAKRIELVEQCDRVKRQRSLVEEEWEKWRMSSGLPDDWTPEMVSRLAAELATYQLKVGQSRDLQCRADEMQDDLTKFVQQLDLCISGIADISPERAAQMKQLVDDKCEAEAARDLFRALDQQRQNEQQRKVLATQRQELAFELEAKNARRQHIERELAAMYTNVGVDNESAFRKVVEEFQRRSRVAEKLQHLQDKLAVLAGDESLIEWQAESLSENAEDFATQERLVDDQLREAEQGMEAAMQRIAVLREQTSGHEPNSSALAASQRLEEMRAELASVVDRWAPLVLANELMNRALKQFEREHQPALLARVAQLLRQMTGGRYLHVSRRFDKDQSLVVQRDDGACLFPQQLSTGTREQLYLAIRLAFVLHYCDRHEPLPIVMDDVLVNFDDHRVRATLEVLDTVASDVQVILLTCHQRTVEVCRDVCTDWAPIVIGRQPLELPEIDDRSNEPTRRSRRRRGATPSDSQGTFF